MCYNLYNTDVASLFFSTMNNTSIAASQPLASGNGNDFRAPAIGAGVALPFTAAIDADCEFATRRLLRETLPGALGVTELELMASKRR